eukprot:2492292-Amphidinium_carterae.1
MAQQERPPTNTLVQAHRRARFSDAVAGSLTWGAKEMIWWSTCEPYAWSSVKRSATAECVG